VLSRLDHDELVDVERWTGRDELCYALEAEINRASKPLPRRCEPEADHCDAARRLQHALATATGCEAGATPQPRGFQPILDQASATALLRLLRGDIESQ
jgi:hypothetical protein